MVMPRLNNGTAKDPSTSVHTTGVTPVSDTMDVYQGDTLADITYRAYGVNTPELQRRLTSANTRMEGRINVPR